MATIVCKGTIFNKIEAIIFDKDGTLENSQFFLTKLAQVRIDEIEARIPGMASELTKVFGIKHNALDPAGLTAVGSRQENELATAACIVKTGCGWFTAKQIVNEAFVAASQLVVRDANTSPLFVGCLPVLKTLAQAKVKLGILSADSTAGVRNFIERSHLSEYIELAMGVDDEINKPDPRLFVRACQAMSVNPHSTLMVGDSLGDIAMATAAKAAGTIGISWDNNTVLTAANVTISNLSEIQILNSSN
ncbi:HAD family hydrolase [Myxosarcina sp. GI1]|uniref:HAD family hydrolase n=1 Tax=Myxosarcina sp. GI1 TaxID=1541065 RepID=UPI0005691B9E|nr:HAD-IA family hydrolase [Myxosarcina sp. GI1]